MEIIPERAKNELSRFGWFSNHQYGFIETKYNGLEGFFLWDSGPGEFFHRICFYAYDSEYWVYIRRRLSKGEAQKEFALLKQRYGRRVIRVEGWEWKKICSVDNSKSQQSKRHSETISKKVEKELYRAEQTYFEVSSTIKGKIPYLDPFVNAHGTVSEVYKWEVKETLKKKITEGCEIKVEATIDPGKSVSCWMLVFKCKDDTEEGLEVLSGHYVWLDDAKYSPDAPSQAIFKNYIDWRS